TCRAVITFCCQFFGLGRRGGRDEVATGWKEDIIELKTDFGLIGIKCFLLFTSHFCLQRLSMASAMRLERSSESTNVSIFCTVYYMCSLQSRGKEGHFGK